MAKIYSEKPVENTGYINPKEETVNFLLNYSKALNVVGFENKKFELILN